jgi:septum formation protein
MSSRPLVILASNSPRRKQLLADLGIEFEVRSANVAEHVPSGMIGSDVPEYLAKIKAEAVHQQAKNSLVIAADTVVILEESLLGKPKNRQEAKDFLLKLSGKKHQVVTGVCIIYKENTVLFKDTTLVSFRELSQNEVDHYLDKYHPFDKAGAYGIQEWIGMIGVTGIEGSYFNVVGLPVHKLYQELMDVAGELEMDWQ